MNITDLNGNNIEVTDLREAIKQAAFFKGFCTEPPKPIADERVQAYWKDIHKKLLALQDRQAKDNPPNNEI